MKVNHEAIYATKASPVAPLPWGRCTRIDSKNTTTLFFTVFNWPDDGKLFVPGLKNRLVSAHLLSGGKIKVESANGGVEMKVPAIAPDPVATVIKVVVKGEVPNVNLTARDKMKTGALD